MSYKHILDSFKSYLIDDGKGPATVVSYVGDVRGFLEWLSSRGISFDNRLSRSYITIYKSYLLESNYNIHTVNKKVNSLHSFNHFLIFKGLCTEQAVFPRKDKVKIAYGSEHEVDTLSDKEFESLLVYMEDRSTVSQRDRMIVYILLYTGLRVSELVNLRIQDIDLLLLNLKVIGKGGKYREIPLKQEVAKCIQEYISGERSISRFSDSEYLIVTQRSKKANRDTINKILRHYGSILGLVLPPHKCRHTFCSRLLLKGVDITTVSKLAGHASIQTTSQFYINTSRETKSNAVNLL